MILVAGAASIAAVAAIVPRAGAEDSSSGAAGGAVHAPAGSAVQGGRAADLRMLVPVAPPPDALTRKVRNVTPDGVTAGPTVTGPLIRVAPPPEIVAPPQARTERLFNPLVTAAGIIKLRDREVRLAGIQPPAFDLRCGEGMAAWPCGRMARAALRRFIRGRAIECDVPAGAAALPDAADCRVAGQNLAEWLVKQGWAKGDGTTYAALETAARERKSGLWGDKWPGGYPDEVAANSR